MKDRRSALIALISALVVIILIVVIYNRYAARVRTASYAPTTSSLQAGDTAPEFRIASTSGLFDVDAQRRPVLLEIFASWCPHCQRETVVMNRLFAAFKSRITFLAIPGSTTGMDGVSPESEADLLAFIQRFHVSYPVAVFDPEQTAADEYIQGGYPTIAVIGTNKKILFIGSGEISYATLAAQLQSAR